jgi:hypothetical protein
MWCFTVNISGETYIEAGVPYMVTCSVSQYRDNRVTIYRAELSEADTQTLIIAHSNTTGCYYQETGGYVPCQSGLCSCDMNGLATHWTCSTSANLLSPVTFRCSSKDNDGVVQTSSAWTPIIARKCLVFMFYNVWCC